MSVDDRAAALYGAPLPRADGVVHVTAVAREPDGLRVMKIGPAPKSATDFFALELTRARVDAVLVSGSVLRAEPSLRYDLSAPLAAWRTDHGLGPLTLLVLTRGSDLPAAHPVWSSEARPLVFTRSGAAPALRAALPERVEIVGVADPSPRGAIEHLRASRGHRSVSVEAGPRVAVPLYAPPSAIDEVVLSVFEGAIPDEARGGSFLDEATLGATHQRVGGPTAVDEPSGRWVFSRWLRRP